MSPCHLQRTSMGSVLIYIEFPTWHWHFDPMLNATVLTTRVVIRIYIFHDYQFHSSVMSSFFYLHDPYNDITLDAVRPPSILLCSQQMRRQIQTHAWHWLLHRVWSYRAILPIDDPFDLGFLFFFRGEPGVRHEMWAWFQKHSSNAPWIRTKMCMRKRVWWCCRWIWERLCSLLADDGEGV